MRGLQQQRRASAAPQPDGRGPCLGDDNEHGVNESEVSIQVNKNSLLFTWTRWGATY